MKQFEFLKIGLILFEDLRFCFCFELMFFVCCSMLFLFEYIHIIFSSFVYLFFVENPEYFQKKWNFSTLSCARTFSYIFA